MGEGIKEASYLLGAKWPEHVVQGYLRQHTEGRDIWGVTHHG